MSSVLRILAFVACAFAGTSLALPNNATADMAGSRVVKCDDAKMVAIYLRPQFGTIINFPVKPENVVLGSQKLFSVEYIKNDIAITTLNPQAKTNLFAYLAGRRCGFLLISSADKHDSLINVRDPEEGKLKVKFE